MAVALKNTFGINLFHSAANLTGTAREIIVDEFINKHGCKKFRLNGLPYNFAPSNQQYLDSIDCIEYLLSRGCYVKFGLTLNVVHTTNATQTDVTVNLKTALEDLATRAEAFDWGSFPTGAMLEIYVGNEEEDNIKLTSPFYGGAADATAAKALFRSDVRNVLAPAVKAIYTHGPVTYTTYQSEWSNWIADFAATPYNTATPNADDLDGFSGNCYRASAYIMESARSQAVFDVVNAMISYGKNRFNLPRIDFSEIQSYDSGLNDTRWIKTNESMLGYDVARRFKLIWDKYEGIDVYYFAGDVSSTNWDYLIRGGSTKVGEFRRFQQFFKAGGDIEQHTNPKYFLQEQLIANPLNNPNLDVFGWQTENSSTRTVVTSGGFDGGRFLRVLSTTHGNSDVYTNSSFSGGMQIPKNMVGIPILMAFWAKYDPSNIPTGTGEASVTLATSAGTHQIVEGSNNFTPTADWQRFYYVFKVTQACNITLRLWGKKQFTTSQGTVDFDNLAMIPMFNDLAKSQILENHLTEGFYTGSPYTQYQQEPTGSTNVECIRVMPPSVPRFSYS